MGYYARTVVHTLYKRGIKISGSRNFSTSSYISQYEQWKATDKQSLET